MEPVKLVISRAKWGRGIPNGGLLLNKETGLMCCLGFECLRVGIPEEAIAGRGLPGDVDSDFQDKLVDSGLSIYNGRDEETDEKVYYTALVCCTLANINDEPRMQITEERREAEIKDVFLKMTPPRIVEFVD